MIFAGLWYLTASKEEAKYNPAKDSNRMWLTWLVFFLFPLISVGVALYLYGNASPRAFPWFAIFLLIDVAVIYWLSTAISTPGLLAHIATGSGFLRRLFRIDID